MDDDLLYTLTIDGNTLLTGVEWQFPKDLLKDSRYATKQPIPIAFEIRNFKEGEYTLNIRDRSKTMTHKANWIADASWSRKQQTLYFIEGTFESMRIGFWNAKKGFGSMRSLKPGIISALNLSVDENYLATSWMKDAGKEIRIFSASLNASDLRIVNLPLWAKKHVMLSENRFLLFRHDQGNYGQIYVWDSSKSDEPKSLSIDGNIIDAMAFNGHLWGLRMFGSPPHLVRLGAIGTTVEEDLGPIHD